MECVRGVFACFLVVAVTSSGFWPGADGQIHGDLHSCPDYAVRCNNTHKCLLPSKLCDGFNDCGDMEDEKTCAIVTTSGPPSGCGDSSLQHGMSNIIQSMNYPYQNYTDLAFCAWDILVPDNYHVKMEFVPLFDIEGDFTGQCRRDALYIYDTNLHHLVGQYCGNTIPAPILLNSSHAVVQFTSDFSSTGRGFGIHWMAVLAPTTTPIAMTGTTEAVTSAAPLNTSCTDNTTQVGTHGLITSPGFDSSHYPSSAQCVWMIVAPPGNQIVLHFDDFMMEYSLNCSADGLSIFDGGDERSPLLDTVCGKHRPVDFVSSGRKLFLRFFSDAGVEGLGFGISWTTISAPTSGTVTETTTAAVIFLTSSSGVVMSPGYDGSTPYRGSLTQQWNITAPEGEVIEITFTDFETEWTRDCYFDYLYIYDGNSSIPNRLCGQHLPADFTSSSNSVLIEFHSDAEVGGVGFNLSYSSHPPRPLCRDSQYICRIDGKCIAYSLVCNGVNDCTHGEDELICSNTTACGQPEIPPQLENARIVGGREAVEGSWPWQVSLRLNGRHMCGGTLVDPYWVISATHCFQSNWRTSDWTVMAGQQELMTSGPHQQLLNASKIILHDDYVDLSSKHDIALIKLAQPALLGRFVNVVCLPQHSDVLLDGEVCYVTGYGETLSTCCARKLKQAAVPKIDTQVCNQPDWYDHQVLKKMVCAGYANGGTDACGGDSGGPLVCQRDQHWMLFGITSWGISCAEPKNPGVYTLVTKYIQWIQGTIAKNS